jgi:hypothetical protein
MMKSMERQMWRVSEVNYLLSHTIKRFYIPAVS